MREVLIISLNFNPAHVSHLVASYKQYEEIGIKATYFVNEKFKPFLPTKTNIIIYKKDKIQYNKYSIALFLFPSTLNISIILRLKKNKTKIIYVFHEPVESLFSYWKSGFRIKGIIKICLADIINTITVWLSNIIILPSKKSLDLYKQHKYYINKNYILIPLLFDDETNSVLLKTKRLYFSYIGTIAVDHSFNEYINFVYEAIIKKDIINVCFLIATKSTLPDNEKIKYLKNNSRIKIIEGKPLSNEEINFYYTQSLVVWNAYSRSNQSGVLVKSLMFGTPTIVLEKNISEFVINKNCCLSIKNNTDYLFIKNAILTILENFDIYSSNSRKLFCSVFYYRNYNDIIKKLLGI